MNHRAFEVTLAELGVPRAHTGALKTGTEHDIVLIEALDVRRLQIGAAPTEIVQCTPRVAMAVFGFLFLDVVLLQHRAPAHAGVYQSRLVAISRSQGAGNDDRLELFRTEHGAAAMGGEMI